MGNKDDGFIPRNAHRFAVATMLDGVQQGLYERWNALAALRIEAWGEGIDNKWKKFKQLIPLIPEKPATSDEFGNDNIHYPEQYAEWRAIVDAAKETLEDEMRRECPTVRIVLEYSPDGRTWYQVPDPDNDPHAELSEPQWRAFIDMHILSLRSESDKERFIRKMML